MVRPAQGGKELKERLGVFGVVGHFVRHRNSCVTVHPVEPHLGKVSGSTIRGFRDSVRFFLKMRNLDREVNWDRLNYLIPHSRKIGKARAPSIEEVRKIVDNADTRLKAVILIMASSGIRVGALDYLNWGDVEPVSEDKVIVGAKLTVYRGEREQHWTFLTPECYDTLLDYRSHGRSSGK